MSTSTRRQFLKTTGWLGGGLTVFGNVLSNNLWACATSPGWPYYKAGAPFSEDLRNENGESLTLQGIVYEHNGKTPLKDAVVEIWHCNHSGHFDFSEKFIYRGKTRTDQNGRYHLKTHFPGRHKEQGHFTMSRIFMLVSGPGHHESFSQLYFDCCKYPYIDNKHWAACPIAERPTLPKRVQAGNQSIITCDHYLTGTSLLHHAGLHETANQQVRLYTNYLHKESQLSFGHCRPGHVVVRILDKKGTVLRKHFYKDLQQNEKPAISIDDLPGGVYTYVIFSSRLGDFTRKLRLG